MTNHEFADRPEQAKEFNHEFIKDVAEALQMAPPAAEAYETVRYPAKVGQFVTPVRYTLVRIEPAEEIDGMLREFAIYMYEQGDVRAIVLLVLPQHVATSERFGERLPLWKPAEAPQMPCRNGEWTGWAALSGSLLRDLTDELVSALLGWLKQHGRSAPTANKARNHLLSMWRYAARKRHVPRHHQQRQSAAVGDA